MFFDLLMVTNSLTSRNGLEGQPRIHSSRSTITEPSDPYFLHHSDSPGLILVTQPLTGGENYSTWSRAMLIAFSVKNKLGFIDGSIPKPSGIDLELVNSWTRNNNVVIFWILNFIK
ncbi:hypothetical protein ACOSQ2_022859 [Xanthoceras sorbifolium]